ncbi:MAG: L-rhamnose mutarotase [Bacteroidota bacterium]
MKKHSFLCNRLFIPGIFLFLLSCHTESGKDVKLKTVVYTCDLKEDDKIIDTYKKLHGEHVWPEVQEAARVSGYHSIRIYNLDNRLVMILEYPETQSLDEINKRYAESNPGKMKEWSELMESFQKAPPQQDSSKTWVEMEVIYKFEK